MGICKKHVNQKKKQKKLTDCSKVIIMDIEKESADRRLAQVVALALC